MIRYGVIGLAETRRRNPFNAVYNTGEELFLGTCDTRGVGGVGVLVNTDAVVDNIDEEYDRLIQHLHVSAMKAKSSKVTKRHLSPRALELIRQRGIARAAGNRELTSELTKPCRQVIKVDLKERRAAVMVEVVEAEKSGRKACRGLANYKTKMIALRRPDGRITASRKAMEEIIHEYY
uniref:Transposase n=1 Tax=Angiostrongylus cantonensis TaxID=6313 RepID=A0A0K0DK06_ANGCA